MEEIFGLFVETALGAFSPPLPLSKLEEMHRNHGSLFFRKFQNVAFCVHVYICNNIPSGRLLTTQNPLRSGEFRQRGQPHKLFNR